MAEGKEFSTYSWHNMECMDFIGQLIFGVFACYEYYTCHLFTTRLIHDPSPLPANLIRLTPSFDVAVKQICHNDDGIHRGCTPSIVSGGSATATIETNHHHGP